MTGRGESLPILRFRFRGNAFPAKVDGNHAIARKESGLLSAKLRALTERAAQLSDINDIVRDRTDILLGDAGQTYAQLSLQQHHP